MVASGLLIKEVFEHETTAMANNKKGMTFTSNFIRSKVKEMAK